MVESLRALDERDVERAVNRRELYLLEEEERDELLNYARALKEEDEYRTRRAEKLKRDRLLRDFRKQEAEERAQKVQVKQSVEEEKAREKLAKSRKGKSWRRVGRRSSRSVDQSREAVHVVHVGGTSGRRTIRRKIFSTKAMSSFCRGGARGAVLLCGEDLGRLGRIFQRHD